MKRIAITILATLCAFAAEAQSSGAEVLRAMSQKLAQMGSYRIDFALEMPGVEESSKGYCLVDGDRYVIDVDGLAQGYDGEAVWMLNNLTKEYTLDSPKPHSRNLFDNPTRAFDFSDEMFEVESFATKSEGQWRVVLLPAEGVLDGIERVVVDVDQRSQLPTLLGYDMAGVGIYIEIVKIAPVKSSADDFQITPPEGYEVIDFR